LQHEWAAGALTACENNIIQLNTCQEKEQLPHKFSFQAMLFFSAYLGLGGGGDINFSTLPP